MTKISNEEQSNNANVLLADSKKCLHIHGVELDYTCVQCKNCGAISYHRDSEGIGQPKEAVWNK